MKWRSILILAFVVVGLSFSFFTLPTVRAEETSCIPGEVGCSPVNTTPGNNSGNAPPNAPAFGGNATNKKIDATACSTSFSVTSGVTFSFSDCASFLITWLIKNTLLQIAGWFLWLSSTLLDYIINVGIFKFSDWAPSSLYPLWQIIRQVISMFVVFSGLWLAFMYIINKSDVFKRYLPWVIIFGLFVNFSYPLTRAAIDLSNIVSLNIYASALGTTAVFQENSPVSAGTTIMKQLGLSKLVIGVTSGNNDSATYDNITSIPAAVLIVGYVIYAAYIFFIAAGILIMRTLTLSFVIIASPLLFVDAVIPKLGDAAQKLRQILFEQLAVSVVFMLMLYVSIKMTSVFSQTIGQAESGLSAMPTITQIFNVLMMLIVLHIMLKVTKSVSGSIGQMAASAVGKVGGFATGAAIGVATGGAGLLARGTIGAAAARWSTSEGLLNQQNTFTGRAKLGLANMMANSSYDLRNTKAMSTAGTMGGLTKGLGVTGRLKTYNESQKEYTAEVARRAGSMKDEASRNDYLNSQRSNTLQGLALGVLGPKDKDGGPAKTSGVLATEAFLKTQAKESRTGLLNYPKASKEDREELTKKASASDKNLYSLMEDYQAVKGDTEAELEKKKSLLVLLKNQGAEEDVIYNLINSDSSNEISAVKNRSRNDKMRLAYADIGQGENKEPEAGPPHVAKQEATSTVSEKGEEMTLESETQVTARLDKQTQEAFQQQIKANQDLNDLVKSFVSKNPGAENISPTQTSSPQTTVASQQPPTQTTTTTTQTTQETTPTPPQTTQPQTAPANEKESTLVT